MDTEAEALLTSTQVAAILHRSAKTVIRMALAGTLPYVQRLPGIQGAFLFRPSDVEAALQQSKESA